MLRREGERAQLTTIPVSRPTSDGAILDKKLRMEDVPAKVRGRTRTASLMARLDESIARSVIHDLCKWRAMSAAEIADLLNKNRDYISSRYITPMVADGVLQYTIPEMPKHPDQRYVVPTDVLRKEA